MYTSVVGKQFSNVKLRKAANGIYSVKPCDAIINIFVHIRISGGTTATRCALAVLPRVSSGCVGK